MNEKFVHDARRRVAAALGVSYASTREIDSNTKAVAALVALADWEEAKKRCSRSGRKV